MPDGDPKPKYFEEVTGLKLNTKYKPLDKVWTLRKIIERFQRPDIPSIEDTIEELGDRVYMKALQDVKKERASNGVTIESYVDLNVAIGIEGGFYIGKEFVSAFLSEQIIKMSYYEFNALVDNTKDRD